MNIGRIKKETNAKSNKMQKEETTKYTLRYNKKLRMENWENLNQRTEDLWMIQWYTRMQRLNVGCREEKVLENQSH